MMELKVGMYVRTDDGYIAKCIYIDNELENIYGFDSIVRRSFGDTYDFIYCKEQEKYITKASNNIIDLIDVGDYVNGYKVVDIKIFSDGNKYVVIATEEHQSFWKDKVFEDEIKSIVTKEQFESMSYEVSK